MLLMLCRAYGGIGSSVMSRPPVEINELHLGHKKSVGAQHRMIYHFVSEFPSLLRRWRSASEPFSGGCGSGSMQDVV